MIKSEILVKLAAAALQSILWEVRLLAHSGGALDRIATLADHGEYLAGMMCDSSARTQDFADYLGEMVRAGEPFHDVHQRFVSALDAR